MPESFKTKLARWGFNLFPAYRGMGARITYIASDWKEVHVKLPLNWRTRNYVGTIYGGSMYGAVDPIYMIMLLKILGKDYIVWDRAAEIKFKKPGKGVLRSVFVLSNAEVQTIQDFLKSNSSINREYLVQLQDESGDICAEIKKVLYIRKKS